MKKKIRNLASILPFAAGAANASDSSSQINETDFWQQVYDSRTAYYENQVGQFSDDILKLGNMIGVWPGGGLYVLSADKIGKSLWAYTTFGLTNPDMPATTTMTDNKVETDAQGRAVEYSATLQKKEQVTQADGYAGYGYEMLLIAKENTEWPLWFLQWSAYAEIVNDAGILDRVEKYQGLTVQDIQVGQQDSVNMLITKAKHPLPTGIELPNGQMTLLVATVITDDEMQWSMENGREALLAKLSEAGFGQVSDRNRASVLK